MAENIMRDGRFPWRAIAWCIPPALLTIPLFAHFPWTLADYIVMGVMLCGAGLVLELLVRASGSFPYRLGAGVAVLAAFGLVWVNAAVGFLGDEDNPANLMFFGVLGVAVIGAVIAGLRARGMARAMFATSAAQVLVAVVALVWQLGSPGSAGLYEAVMGTSLFTAMWLVAGGGLFRAAARS